MYYLRGKKLTNEQTDQLLNWVMIQAVGGKVPRRTIKDIQDFAAENPEQAKTIDMYSTEQNLNAHYALATYDHMLSGEAVERDRMLVLFCKHFGRPIEDLKITIWAVRDACHEPLTEIERQKLEYIKTSLPKDRAIIERVTSAEGLNKAVEEVLYYSPLYSEPVTENKMIHMLLKGIGISPEEFFDEKYLLLKYDKEIVEKLIWKAEPDRSTEPNLGYAMQLGMRYALGDTLQESEVNMVEEIAKEVPQFNEILEQFKTDDYLWATLEEVFGKSANDLEGLRKNELNMLIANRLGVDINTLNPTFFAQRKASRK